MNWNWNFKWSNLFNLFLLEIFRVFRQTQFKIFDFQVITFIDFSKAFDSINRKKMFKILKAYGIPPTLLNTIIAMYTNTRAKVVSPDGDTDLFEITMGVLQGDTLAPFLFVIVLDYAMKKSNRWGKNRLMALQLNQQKAGESRPKPSRTWTSQTT